MLYNVKIKFTHKGSINKQINSLDRFTAIQKATELLNATERMNIKAILLTEKIERFRKELKKLSVEDVVLKDGLAYMLKETGEYFTLNKDYNGLWYLDNRREIGYKKTTPQESYVMRGILRDHYERVVVDEKTVK